MRRWLAVVVVAVGCGREEGPASIQLVPAEPPPPEVPAPPPLEPYQALAAAGACAEEGAEATLAVVPTDLADAHLLLVHCAFYAYQGTFEVWREAGGVYEPVRDDQGAPLRGLGVPVFEEDRVFWLEKDRGLGDCGTSRAYRYQGGRLVLTEERRRDCDASRGDPANPWTWPLTALTGTLTDLQGGDHGCSIVLDGDRYVGGADLCADDGLKGKPVRLTLAEKPSPAPSCAGDPACTDTVPTDVVQAITPL